MARSAVLGFLLCAAIVSSPYGFRINQRVRQMVQSELPRQPIFSAGYKHFMVNPTAVDEESHPKSRHAKTSVEIHAVRGEQKQQVNAATSHEMFVFRVEPTPKSRHAESSAGVHAASKMQKQEVSTRPAHENAMLEPMAGPKESNTKSRDAETSVVIHAVRGVKKEEVNAGTGRDNAMPVFRAKPTPKSQDADIPAWKVEATLIAIKTSFTEQKQKLMSTEWGRRSITMKQPPLFHELSYMEWYEPWIILANNFDDLLNRVEELVLGCPYHLKGDLKILQKTLEKQTQDWIALMPLEGRRAAIREGIHRDVNVLFWKLERQNLPEAKKFEAQLVELGVWMFLYNRVDWLRQDFKPHEFLLVLSVEAWRELWRILEKTNDLAMKLQKTMDPGSSIWNAGFWILDESIVELIKSLRATLANIRFGCFQTFRWQFKAIQLQISKDIDTLKKAFDFSSYGSLVKLLKKDNSDIEMQPRSVQRNIRQMQKLAKELDLAQVPQEMKGQSEKLAARLRMQARSGELYKLPLAFPQK